MKTSASRTGPPEILIAIGSGIFILALAIAAVFVPEIRVLHVFQASMYVVTIVLSFRHNRWGHFIGISAAGLWDYAGLFASPLFANLLDQPFRPDLLIQRIAWLANFLLICGCLWAYGRLPDRPRGDLVRLVAAFVVTTAFLVAATAIFAPDYLDHFREMLHPHWPG